MPYPVQSLLENKAKPVAARLSTPVTDALSLMLENDFSQLPVVDQDFKPIGFITYRSIVRTLTYMDVLVEHIQVEDSYEDINKTHIFREDDNLIDMLDRLRDTNAIVIVDGNDRLTGIITSYDATEYFRMRAEDMMQVEDIETTLKEIILAAFSRKDGETDIGKLQAAIEKISSSIQPAKTSFAKALSHYLNLLDGSKITRALMEQSYEEHLKLPSKIPAFHELTLGDYIELLLLPDQDEFFQRVFPYTQKQIRKLLNGVRETRNALAHFREITPAQRDQLSYCKNLLEKITVSYPVSIPVAKPVAPAGYVIREQVSDYGLESQHQIIPTEEEALPTESKYAPLIARLLSTPQDQKQVQFTFDEINEILNDGLPPSARTHRAWWANDSVGHVQSQQWLDAGWRTTYINMTDETVIFSRIKEMEKRYIEFFGGLASDLKKTDIPHKETITTTGKNWLTVYRIPETGPGVAAFGFSFSTQRRFRVDLYIDSGDRDQNKAIFDRLHARKTEIEHQFGRSVTWERIDRKRASRIAVYTSGHINASDTELEQLKSWAVREMGKFVSALLGSALDVIEAVVGK